MFYAFNITSISVPVPPAVCRLFQYTTRTICQVLQIQYTRQSLSMEALTFILSVLWLNIGLSRGGFPVVHALSVGIAAFKEVHDCLMRYVIRKWVGNKTNVS